MGRKQTRRTLVSWLKSVVGGGRSVGLGAIVCGDIGPRVVQKMVDGSRRLSRESIFG
jgi:hypothetical protein